MTPRKADVTAADRLLKAAVKEAQERIADADEWTVSDWTGQVVRRGSAYDREATVQMLAEATRSADLLLGGGER